MLLYTNRVSVEPVMPSVLWVLWREHGPLQMVIWYHWVSRISSIVQVSC